MARRKPVLLSFDAEPYGCQITVICGATDRQVRQYLRDHDCEVEDADMDQLDVESDDGRTYYIEDGHVVSRYREREPSAGRISHESFHATCVVMSRAGALLTDASEEPWAYLLDSIVEKTWAASR